MNSLTLDLLEYPSILSWLAEETHSSPGAAFAKSLKPDLTPEEIKHSWQLIEEAREVLTIYGSPVLRDNEDLSQILENLLPEGARLETEELLCLKRMAECSKNIKAFFQPAEELAPEICKIVGELDAFPELLEALCRSLGPDGEILDSASPELSRLRQEQSSARQALSLKLSDIMRSEEFRPLIMDEIITTRQGRYVLPVRASATGKNRGLVHDWSNSGATAFMEPLEAVEDNNRLRLLKRREKEELERILVHLSKLCHMALADLALSSQIMTRLDVLLAQGRLARLWEAVTPDYQPNQGYRLMKLRHPLLERRLKAEGRHMSPLDLIIDPSEPLLIISGLNTGGKTVAMKTLGLTLALAKSGFPIPAALGSRLDFPDDILAVMGDSQDLGTDLSTFSGHALAISRILTSARPGYLILLDEPGAGTDPAEGAAFGLSVLETLKSSGAIVLAATHFHLVKSWAALTPGVVSVAVNASPEGQPIYGLSYGSPGFSGGLAMAKRLGLPEELIKRAESYLDQGQKRALDLLQKLDDERGALIKEKNSLEEQRLSLARAEKEHRDLAQSLTETFSRRARDLDESIKKALTKNRLEFEILKKQMRETKGQGIPDQAISLKKAELERELILARPEMLSLNDEKPLNKVIVGEMVLVKKLGQKGLVKAYNKEKNEVIVEVGLLTVKTFLEDLYQATPEKKSEYNQVMITISPKESSELSINLLGHTVDEAITAVDREIDRAILDGRNHLTVIHGLGTGRLRHGIQGHLKAHSKVKNFFSPESTLGGHGVTEVELF